MSRALSLFRFIELLLGVPLALRMLMTSNNDWGILYLLVLYVAISAVFFAIALWAWFYRRELRRTAVWVMLLPVGLVVLPVVVRNLAAGPLSATLVLGLLAVVVIVVLVWAIANPRDAGQRLPLFLFRSRALNFLIVFGLALAWIAPFGMLAVLKHGSNVTHSEQGSPGMGLAYVIALFAFYFLALGASSVFTAIWGWIGFRSELVGAQRTLHMWQMAMALPGLVIGALAWLWLKSQGGV
jgi:hypothetical protein